MKSKFLRIRLPNYVTVFLTVFLTVIRVALLMVVAAATTLGEPSTTGHTTSHWAFQVPERPNLPDPVGADDRLLAWPQNPIDAFVAARHHQHQLAPAFLARKETLLRRVYLDLIGLPPTQEELRGFLADDSVMAYQKVVDRLLASPLYGERWGRHWMDVWRYSDWYGRRHVPDVWNSAPQIWHWRDWIVRSLNEDKGYDRMILEMLAGDEIAPLDDDTIVATGYLIRNWYALNPNDWMRSNVEHVSKAFLGLTMNCAHCHDHKYDPISQDDYFAMRAFFEPIAIRQDRIPGQADPGPFQDYDYSTLRKIQRLGLVRIYDKTPDAPTWFYTGGDERNRISERGSIAPRLPTVFGDLPHNIEPIAYAAEAWYPGRRTDIQATMLDDCRTELTNSEQAREAAEAELESANAGDKPLLLLQLIAAESKVAAVSSLIESVQARINADRARFDEAGIQDDPISPEHLQTIASRAERTAAVKSAEAELRASEHQWAAAEGLPADDAERASKVVAATKQLADAKQTVADAWTALSDPQHDDSYSALTPTYPSESTGRRRALAQWIASDRNPLTARVAVNHIWSWHFHKPLVETVFDFGKSGDRPTHPQLLDWLAVELVESGWSMKRIHRWIVTSQTYRMSSSLGESSVASQAASQAASQTGQAIDPENRLLWRMNVGRMEAEVVRDSILACAGRLDSTMRGQELENSETLTTRRRTLYYSCHPESDGKSEFGRLFDAPEPRECYLRTRSIVPQQALALTNSQFVHEMSVALADRVAREANRFREDPRDIDLAVDEFIESVFARLLSRSPTSAELDLCRRFLAEQLNLLPESGVTEASAAVRAGLVRVLLNHNDFITVR